MISIRGVHGILRVRWDLATAPLKETTTEESAVTLLTNPLVYDALYR